MRSAQSAFTLVELLIVVSIIAILTGAILPSFSTYINNQTLRQAQEQIKDDLRSVQNRALSGDNATRTLSGLPVAFWGIEYGINGRDYQTFISVDTTTCNGANPSRRLNMKKSTILPGEYVIRTVGVKCIFFSFKNGDAVLPVAGLGGGTIIVGPATGNNVCRRVRVSTNGLIESGLATEIGCT